MPDLIGNKVPTPELPRPSESETQATAERQLEPETAKAAEQPVETAVVPIQPPAAPTPAPVDPVASKIEKILSEDLYDFYTTMPPDLQVKFKIKGEETVSRLSALVSQVTIKAKEVVRLIIEWLKLIPGINKYFLEQESKIKADKVLHLHKRTHEQ